MYTAMSHTYIITIIVCTDFIGPPGVRVNTVKNIEDLSIVVQWNAVDDFLRTTYTVVWTDEGNLFDSYPVEEVTSHTITGLTLDTVYNITVTPSNMCGGGPDGKTRVSFPTGTTFTIIIYHFVIRLLLLLHRYFTISNTYIVT